MPRRRIYENPQKECKKEIWATICFIFEFNDLVDKEIILLNRPLSLLIWEATNGAVQILFTKASFWIQVHNLPLKGMMVKVAKAYWHFNSDIEGDKRARGKNRVLSLY